MSQLNDVFADMPLKYRKMLFEDHITNTEFSKGVHHKMHIGGKYETKYNNFPTCTYYSTSKDINYIRARSSTAKIRKPLNLYKRPESPRPAPNDNFMKPFGQNDANQPRVHPQIEFPKPKMAFYPGAMWNKKGKTKQASFKDGRV